MANFKAKGRPRVPKPEKPGQIIPFRMTGEERKRGAAKKAGGKLSEWICQTLLEAAGKG